MIREIIDKKILEEAARKLEGVDELTIVNSRIVGCFTYKRDERLFVEFPDKEFTDEDINELFDAEDSLCTMNGYPVPIKFAFLPNNYERFLFQRRNAKGFKKWEIYSMRKAIGFDSLIGII